MEVTQTEINARQVVYWDGGMATDGVVLATRWKSDNWFLDRKYGRDGSVAGQSRYIERAAGP